jgi:hypothetical protein
MIEKVENKRENSSSEEKKYITVWRNKWITSGAGSIDDFIRKYEQLAEQFKEWKADGIILDPDIIGGVGDDYAQFCTSDEKVALKHGFEEDDEDFYEEDPYYTPLKIPEFQVNEFISLKLVGGYTQIFMEGKLFKQCKYLFLINPERAEQQEEIDSIDEVSSLYKSDLEKDIKPEDIGITKEQEFWGHCSNLQTWAENNYDSRILHRNLAFPLLKRLAEIGDPTAQKVFKDEVAERFASGFFPVMGFLFQDNYLDYLTSEEFSTLLDTLDYNSLDLDALLNYVNDYIGTRHGRLFLKRILQEYEGLGRDNYPLLRLPLLKVDKSEMNPTVITSDNHYFIRGSNDGKLKVFKCLSARPEVVKVFGEHTKSVDALAISPHDRYIASVAEKDIKVWDFATEQLIATLQGHKDDVNCLAFSSDLRFLASGSIDFKESESAIKIWDLETWEVKWTLNSHWRTVSCLEFSQDGGLLVSGSFDTTVNLWDMTTGTLIKTFVGHTEPVVKVAMTRDNSTIVSCAFGNIVKLWDVQSGKMIDEGYLEVGDAQLISFVLSPDGKFLITGFQGSPEEGAQLVVWNITEQTLIQSHPIRQDFPGEREELSDIVRSPRGDVVMGTFLDRMVVRWVSPQLYLDYIRDEEKYRALCRELTLKNL